MADHERRAFTRLCASLDVAVDWGGGIRESTELADLSIGGAFVRVSPPRAVGTPCRLVLGTRSPNSEPMVLRACVAHAQSGGVGLRFDELSLESFERLHGLLLELGSDPMRMEEELERGWGAGLEDLAS
jgi:hypothetical protein